MDSGAGRRRASWLMGMMGGCDVLALGASAVVVVAGGWGELTILED